MLKLLFLSLLLATTGCAHHKHINQKKPFAHRKEVQHFIQDMHQKHEIDKAHLTSLFGQYSPNPKVVALMDKQFKPSPWYQYRDRILTDKRTSDGVHFWQTNHVLLKKAEKHFGVPAEIIVAIIGVETAYGQIMGTYPVLQTLSTLAFDYPRRAPYFKKELEHFLLLSKEGALHPLKVNGSYAGAMGIPQFMPSSYRQFAVDFTGKGTRNLYNTSDAIGSIANYLKLHGWHPNTLIATRSHHQHVTTQKEKIITLETGENKKEPWIVYHNFQVIKSYNNSNFYAMSVYLLSERIRKLYYRRP